MPPAWTAIACGTGAISALLAAHRPEQAARLHLVTVSAEAATPIAEDPAVPSGRIEPHLTPLHYQPERPGLDWYDPRALLRLPVDVDILAIDAPVAPLTAEAARFSALRLRTRVRLGGLLLLDPALAAVAVELAADGFWGRLPGTGALIALRRPQ
ncbi:MAG: hypothetical protein AAGE18_01155 [Pseudomonadota bacterium]